MTRRLNGPGGRGVCGVCSVRRVDRVDFAGPGYILLVGTPGYTLRQPTLNVPSAGFVLLGSQAGVVAGTPVQIVSLDLLRLRGDHCF